MLLNWRATSHFSDTARPCVLCRKPAHLRSHSGEPVHKTCAETWNAQNPERAFDGRFVSDPEPQRRRPDPGAHA